MPSLSNFPVAKQEGVNSCWACASRMINNYYVALGKGGANKKIDSDTDLAKLVGLSIDKQESASAVLATLKYANNADSAPIPTKRRSVMRSAMARRCWRSSDPTIRKASGTSKRRTATG